MNQHAAQEQNNIPGDGAPPASGTTPVPNVLLDRTMPILRDTELRVLLVVVRATLGWQDGPDPARRKERDWLTQSQLMWRTGRANGVVSRAVDALVQASLINVTDRRGIPLRTPAERRRQMGHLYYQTGSGDENVCAPVKSGHAKAHTTKETVIQKYRARKEIVDNFVEKPPLKKPLIIRTNEWEKVTR